MTEQMLRQYTVLVDYLGQTLCPDYEVVLHEILPENSRVAAIANGSISGRSVGAPLTNAALRMIMQKQYETSDYNLNYTGRLANGDHPLQHHVYQGRRQARRPALHQF